MDGGERMAFEAWEDQHGWALAAHPYTDEERTHMDPNANLQEQDAIRLCLGPRPDARLRELRIALYYWLDGGGFRPDWSAYPEATLLYRAWVARYLRGALDRTT